MHTFCDVSPSVSLPSAPLPFLRTRLFLIVASGLILSLSAVFLPAARAQSFSGTSSPAESLIVGKSHSDTHCRILYAGFVGALELPNNKSSGVVQIRDTLLGPAYPDVCAASFSPYTWTSGLEWLLKHFPSHSGILTKEELAAAPKVILVGHSMGGWSALSVARQLRDKNIPVELSIQVDSVGVTDYTLPRNVHYAAIFHANDVLMFMTTKKIRFEDPAQTKLLANILVKGVGHQSITRDPRIRELVLDSIEALRAEHSSALSSQQLDSPSSQDK
jgi:hypothetical protein